MNIAIRFSWRIEDGKLRQDVEVEVLDPVQVQLSACSHWQHKLITNFRSHCEVSPNEDVIFVHCQNGAVQVYLLPSFTYQRPMSTPPYSCKGIFARAGREFLFGDEDGGLMFRPFSQWSEHGPLRHHKGILTQTPIIFFSSATVGGGVAEALSVRAGNLLPKSE